MARPSAPTASSSSSPLNTKTHKTPKKHKGKAKVVSPKAATPAARIIASQSSGSAAASPSSPGYDEIIESGDYGDFDHDAMKADDDGVELWLVRAPRTVKARNLRDLEIDSSRVGLVGDLMRKGTAYDLWALDPAASSGESASRDQDELGGRGGGATSPSFPPATGVSAEELNSLSVLLPCKRKGGKLYLVQKPITRHLVVSARPAKPTKPDAAYEAPKREAYPDEVLTHRFRPYGDPGDLPREDHMDVDVAEVSPKAKERSKRKGGSETGSSKKKKAKLAASQ